MCVDQIEIKEKVIFTGERFYDRILCLKCDM